MKQPFPFRVVTGVLLASMLVIPLGVFLSSIQPQAAIVAEVGNVVADAEGDWMVTITLTNRSSRDCNLRGNSSDFLLHEIKSGEESLRYPPELDEHQTNHVYLRAKNHLTTQVFVPARMEGQNVRVGFHLEEAGSEEEPSFMARIGRWWESYRWGKTAETKVIETAPFVPGS